jgi:hypothetical protein
MALVIGGLVWVLYLALEPYLRRNWPGTLISWTRLLSGRLRDPIVGRDLLIGACGASLVVVAVAFARTRLPVFFGAPPPMPIPDDHDVFLGLRFGIATLAQRAVVALAVGMGMLLLRLGLRKTLRWELLVAVAFVSIMSLQDALLAGSAFWVMLGLTAVVSGIPLYLVTRLGLLPTIVGLFVVDTALVFPQAPSVGHWAAEATLIGLLPTLALAIYGFHATRTATAMH